MAVLRHVRRLEVHEHKALVDLDDAVLETSLDTQLLLDREDEGWLPLLWNVLCRQIIELHQRLKQRRHDRAAPRQADLPWHVRVIACGEVLPRQRDARGGAELLELLARGHEEAGPAVVALPAADEVQIREAAEGRRVVERVREKPKLLGLPELHGGPEVADGRRDGLAVEAVAGVADEADPGVGLRPYVRLPAIRVQARLSLEALVELQVLVDARGRADEEEGAGHAHAPEWQPQRLHGMLHEAAEAEGADALRGRARREPRSVVCRELLPSLGREDAKERRDERVVRTPLPRGRLLRKGRDAARGRVNLAHPALGGALALATAVVQQHGPALYTLEGEDPLKVEVLEEERVPGEDDDVAVVDVPHRLPRPPQAQLDVPQHASAALRGRRAGVDHAAYRQVPRCRPTLELLVVQGIADDEDLGDGAVRRQVAPPMVEHRLPCHGQKRLRQPGEAPKVRLRGDQGAAAAAANKGQHRSECGWRGRRRLGRQAAHLLAAHGGPNGRL
mmetsp:Transcript_84311/g.243719  ORF Transcript_84311/g.243719 Transcript_84311/m.243719 type:complete len:506 (-) Transcript_84311:218-1735(-)